MLITLKEAAAIMGIVSTTIKREQNRIWELYRAGKLPGFPAVKIGSRWYVHKEKLIVWMSERAAA